MMIVEDSQFYAVTDKYLEVGEAVGEGDVEHDEDGGGATLQSLSLSLWQQLSYSTSAPPCSRALHRTGPPALPGRPSPPHAPPHAPLQQVQQVQVSLHRPSCTSITLK